MCLNSYWTLQACQSSMELHRHDGLRWGMLVTDKACQLRWVSDEACQGLQSGTSVSDGSPIGLRY